MKLVISVGEMMFVTVRFHSILMLIIELLLLCLSRRKEVNVLRDFDLTLVPLDFVSLFLGVALEYIRCLNLSYIRVGSVYFPDVFYASEFFTCLALSI